MGFHRLRGGQHVNGVRDPAAGEQHFTARTIGGRTVSDLTGS
jgi:hypothetical protein